MNEPMASLDNLRDIVEPPPVSWWPLAPGWWILSAGLVLTAIFVALRVMRMWRASAYRRAALRELQATTRVAEIAEILKRVALAAYPRADVAPLSGVAWVEWLGRTAEEKVPAHVSEALTRGVFDDDSAVDIAPISDFAADWIRDHRVAPISDSPASQS